jgi:hypothetical protein
MQEIHHKKNELFEIEFYKDKECTEAFVVTSKECEKLSIDFKCENLYLVLQNGDITPLCSIPLWAGNIYIPYIPKFAQFESIQEYSNSITTLDDITPNLSKYIPKDNAVLFLSEQDMEKYKDYFPNNHIGLYINDGKNDETFIANNTESLINGIVVVKKGNTTIFLPNGTQSELQKVNEVGKHLWKNFGIKPNLCVLHCFQYICSSIFLYFYPYLNEEDCYINKIITTNSTGILPVDNKDRLQVIDCREIFEEYLQNER